MATKVDEKMIIEINERYLVCKNKSQVAREIGVSPSTVSKYIIKDYISKDNQVLVKFDKDYSAFSPLLLTTDNFGSLCSYTEEEEHQIKELWKEMLV